MRIDYARRQKMRQDERAARRRLDEAKAKRVERLKRAAQKAEARAEQQLDLRLAKNHRLIPATPDLDLTTAAELRDQVIGSIRRKGLSFEQVSRLGGPSPQTLSKWQAKEVRRPHMLTVIKALRVLGMEIHLS